MGHSRLIGVDVARAAAVVGMVIVHFGPRAEDATGLAGALYTLPRGRASLLFALLAGVSLALAADPVGRGRPQRLGWTLLNRSAILLPVGLALQTLGHGVHVILQFYALYFGIAWLALKLPRRAQLLGAGTLMLVGPLLFLVTWSRLPDGAVIGGAPQLGDPPGPVLVSLLVTGAYPAVTWAGPVLFGVWLGRADLRSVLVRRRMFGAGVAVAGAAWALSTTALAVVGAPGAGPGWRRLLLDEAHSQMPLWLVGSTGGAVAVLAAALWGAERHSRAVAPLADLGRLALTAYVLHLLLLAAVPQVVSHPEVGLALGSVAVFTGLAVGGAVLWRRRFCHGPLEVLLRAPPPRRRRSRRTDARPDPAGSSQSPAPPSSRAVTPAAGPPSSPPSSKEAT